MRVAKAIYFFIFALGGSVVPFISLYFQQHGLKKDQIGYVQGVAAIAVVLSPILLTFLADARLDARRILAAAMLVASAALAGLYLGKGFVATLLIWAIHMLAYVPLSSLQDGITFAVMKRREEQGLAVTPYHRVRVWGSIGFMLPSVILYFVVKKTVTPILFVGGAFGILGAIAALMLPNPDGGEKKKDSRLPTMEAARRMFTGPLLIFCLASFLLNAGQAPYYTYYALYLKEKAGIPQQWVGLISSVGVVVEIFFLLAFAKLLGKWGLKKLMIVGAGCVALRMLLMALWPTPAIAIGTQLLHGMTVLVILIAPPVFLNQHAEDRYRHSMQGLYAMAVMGSGRIMGNLIAGPISKWSLQGVYASAALLSVIAMGLLWVAFYEEEHQKQPIMAASAQPDPAAAPAISPEISGGGGD
jgi:PPP family 3-phenylpropionic acid transporter